MKKSAAYIYGSQKSKQLALSNLGAIKLGLFCLLITLQSCSFYSFKGINIDESLKTFYVKPFENTALIVVPSLSFTFAEKLKDRIRRDTRLKFGERKPDLEFIGTIVGYEVTSEAPLKDGSSGFNKLTIRVKVECINNQNEKENWNQEFSFFENFPSDTNLNAVQDQFIGRIVARINEDIFNKAFGNW